MMEPRLGPSPLRPLRVYGKSPAGPVVQSKFPIPSMAIQLKPEATPYELHHVLLSDDDDFDDDMVEAFEFAAGDDDDSDHDVEFESRDAAEHVFSRIQEEDSCSQGGLSAAGDDLGSQGLGIGNKSISGKKGRKAATPEKRRRRQEEVNRAVLAMPDETEGDAVGHEERTGAAASDLQAAEIEVRELGREHGNGRCSSRSRIRRNWSPGATRNGEPDTKRSQRRSAGNEFASRTIRRSTGRR